ncbi:MAG: ribonuclease III [Patescibacteria group bacterium]|jgi:ribonuclease-3|nr:ribonuclease III [Patescibacteria group bacterium]
MNKKDLQALQDKLGIRFKDELLLKQALVHRSYLNEHPDFKIGHNERLEFLGDAVLEIIVTEYLYNEFPDTPEGDLTNWRASLVNSKILYEITPELEIEKYLYLSKGEAKDKNKKSRQYILADAVEAIIGAIYLDRGIKEAKKFVLKNIVSRLDEVLANEIYLDPKSYFQEKAQEKEGVTPHYEIIEESGPDHAKKFTIGLYLDKKLISKGIGFSKQEGQVAAAINGIKKLSWDK